MTLIKYTGSKRNLAAKIVSKFPRKIKTYYEPFLGSGSVFFEVLKNTSIEVEDFVLSDINSELIGVFNLIKDNPDKLIQSYRENWLILQSSPGHFYNIRSQFNEYRRPEDFYFLTRTCYNGTIRYNSKGQFNTSHHFGRPGMDPNKVEIIIREHNKLMENKNIEILSTSFVNIQPKNDSDVVFLDPPYMKSDSLYQGTFNHMSFLSYLSELNCNWFMTLNGKNKNNNEYNLNLQYDEKIELSSGNSSFSRLKNQDIDVKEFYYIRRKTNF